MSALEPVKLSTVCCYIYEGSFESFNCFTELNGVLQGDLQYWLSWGGIKNNTERFNNTLKIKILKLFRISGFIFFGQYYHCVEIIRHT